MKRRNFFGIVGLFVAGCHRDSFPLPPRPDPVIPVPNPAPPADSPPLLLDKAFEIINDGRRAIGRPSFQWHPKLYRSAQELADYAWNRYLAGKLDGNDVHWQFLERLERAGWKTRDSHGNPVFPFPGRPTLTASECGVGGTSEFIGEDGKSYPKDKNGWHHPFRSPESHAKEYVWFLKDSNLASDYNEGHVWDFRGPWTHAAIGYNAGIFVVDYGIIIP